MSDIQFQALLDFIKFLFTEAIGVQELKQQVLAKLEEMKGEIMAAIDDVQAKVEAQTTVIGSAVTLLNQLKALLDAAGTDPIKLAALSSLIGNNTDALSTAVVANTPAG